jgi:deazaflavin-dependent oxidoreductase (nitroreductase family)
VKGEIMKSEVLKPPQPIPYPKSELIKNLYRIPILLFRLGLAPLIGRNILVISTFGRRTGKVHRTPVEYYNHQGRIYVMSGFGDEPDWYQNLNTDPHVTLNTDKGFINALARKPETSEEWQGVTAYLKHSPVSILTTPELVQKIDEVEVQEQFKAFPVVTFDPTDETCPPALETDLLWAWPIILLLLALRILTGWLWHRRSRR